MLRSEYEYPKTQKYFGVCLTFDIVEEGDNPTELMRSVREAAELHLETIIRNNLTDELLNRYAPEEYWLKYFATAKKIERPALASTNSLTVSPYYRSLTAQMA